MSTIKYHKGSYKYVLAEAYGYHTKIVNEGYTLPHCWIDPDGKLMIRAGYAWDGSSRSIDTKSSMIASLIHDALYQLLRETGFGVGNDKHDVRRYCADQIYRNLCIRDGMWEWWARRRFNALRVGGGPSAAVKARAVHTAP